MKGIIVVSADPARAQRVLDMLPPGFELRLATDLKGLSDVMLWDDSEVVVLDVEHPRVDPLEAVRLVKGTRWDVRLVCIGQGPGAERALRGAVVVLGPEAWADLDRVLGL